MRQIFHAGSSTSVKIGFVCDVDATRPTEVPAEELQALHETAATVSCEAAKITIFLGEHYV